MDKSLTLVELGRHERSRQSLIFGAPAELIPCPYGYRFAVFTPGQTFGYERWKANEYGTTCWQFLVLKTGSNIDLNRVSGVYPGADILFRTRGKDATQRALNWVKTIRKKRGENLDQISELVWRRAANDRLLRCEFPSTDQLSRQALR